VLRGADRNFDTRSRQRGGPLTPGQVRRQTQLVHSGDSISHLARDVGRRRQNHHHSRRKLPVRGGGGPASPQGPAGGEPQTPSPSGMGGQKWRFSNGSGHYQERDGASFPLPRRGLAKNPHISRNFRESRGLNARGIRQGGCQIQRENLLISRLTRSQAIGSVGDSLDRSLDLRLGPSRGTSGPGCVNSSTSFCFVSSASVFFHQSLSTKVPFDESQCVVVACGGFEPAGARGGSDGGAGAGPGGGASPASS
jgi:hypothetical protein